jgi:UDP-2,4-diacetamido-2,4,6-trideoxy-beta-L-altropyranose hydrolase
MQREGVPATRLLPETLKSGWREQQMETRRLAQSGDDVERTVELAREIGADWIVFDGYQFGTEFQRGIKTAGMRLFVLDDDGCARHYAADFILNQSACAVPDMYSNCDSRATLLLGARYALLRREFLPARPANRYHAMRAQKVLVMLGGADPDNCSRAILEAIALIDEITTIVAPRASELAQLARRGDRRISIRRDPPSMPQLMASADLAISAAGSTSWELAFMGLPMLVVVLADNQRLNATCLGKLGMGRNLGWHSELSEGSVRAAVMHIVDDRTLRTSMSQRGSELVDGLGASRVVATIRGEIGY